MLKITCVLNLLGFAAVVVVGVVVVVVDVIALVVGVVMVVVGVVMVVVGVVVVGVGVGESVDEPEINQSINQSINGPLRILELTCLQLCGN